MHYDPETGICDYVHYEKYCELKEEKDEEIEELKMKIEDLEIQIDEYKSIIKECKKLYEEEFNNARYI